MSAWLELDVDIYRENDDQIITVRVAHLPAVAHDWWNPGSPSETWVVAAFDEQEKPVILTEHEADIAVARAVFKDLTSRSVREADMWDDYKPF